MRLTKTEASAIARKIKHTVNEAVDTYWEAKFNELKNSPDFKEACNNVLKVAKSIDECNAKLPEYMQLTSFGVKGGSSIYMDSGAPVEKFIKTAHNVFMQKYCKHAVYEDTIASDVVYASIESKSLDDLVQRLADKYVKDLIGPKEE